MQTLTFPAPIMLPAGEIVATNVPFEEYMARYALTFHEWVGESSSRCRQHPGSTMP
jgi:hypothetical protein